MVFPVVGFVLERVGKPRRAIRINFFDADNVATINEALQNPHCPLWLGLTLSHGSGHGGKILSWNPHDADPVTHA